MNNLPANVYRVRQRDFTAIPREPWVYWIPDDLRQLFETLPTLGEVAQPVVGLQTGKNFRFLRGWWEVGRTHIGFGCCDADEAQATGKRWFPYMKGGGNRKWYGNQSFVVNWESDGKELKNFYKPSGRLASRPQNTSYYFSEGVTYSYLTSASFSARYSPGGFIFDVAGSSLFPKEILLVLSVMNSPYAGYALKLINPTVNFQIGDVARLPMIRDSSSLLKSLTEHSIMQSHTFDLKRESTYDFVVPPRWATGLGDLATTENRLVGLEYKINDEVYRLYGISDIDRAAIKAELAGEPLPTDEDEIEAILSDDGDDDVEPPMDREELAVRWISYAVGVILGRFRVGAIDDSRLTIDETSTDEIEIVNRQSKIVNRKSKIANRPLGSAVYYREDFAVGSLPAPSEAEFDELVGPPERFTYVDDAGGRHVFPAEVEAALRDLAVDDGITVLDEGHSRDLPGLVEKALRLMLDFRLTIDDLRWDREREGDLVNRKSKIVNRPIGNAVYYREDFAVGSLPAPSAPEFDELVGPPERFAYVDDAGGRHVFPAEVEAALRDLAVDDGITVLDEGHSRDLPGLVEKALRLMLDFRLTIDDLRWDREREGDLVNRKSKIVNRPSEEVIRVGAGGDLRAFLSRDFFTDWHIKWYNIPYQAKAPVYWPLQSADRSYGFVLFHEKIDNTTLYTLQRDYLDYKISGLEQRIGDLTQGLDDKKGSERKKIARRVADLRETLAEVEAFAETMARVVREGYEPEPNWIDDRVILRMAPLWELVPLWAKYPKKHWTRLQDGEYDWSHIAMHYWPERVREACRENKSYAIAHGHEEWYEGD